MSGCGLCPHRTSRFVTDDGNITAMLWDPLGRDKEFPLIFSTFSGKLGAFPRDWVYDSGSMSRGNDDDPLVDDSLLMEVGVCTVKWVCQYCDMLCSPRVFPRMTSSVWMTRWKPHPHLLMLHPVVVVGGRGRRRRMRMICQPSSGGD